LFLPDTETDFLFLSLVDDESLDELLDDDKELLETDECLEFGCDLFLGLCDGLRVLSSFLVSDDGLPVIFSSHLTIHS
jgi:hypothetical protein